MCVGCAMTWRRRSGWAAFLAVLSSASSVAGASPSPSFTSVDDNLTYAIVAICAPFALDGVDRKDLPINKGLVQPDGHDGLAQSNPTGVRVGVAGFVHVTFSHASTGSRSCDIQAKAADPQALRRTALSALAQRPEQFAPTKSRYLPGSFATEDNLCAAADSRHPTGSVLLSSPQPGERGGIAIFFTLTAHENRMASCDHEGVQANYRTLAP